MKADGRGDRTLLIEMLDAVDAILDDARLGEAEFYRTPRVQRSMIRSLEVLGEAAKGLSPALRDKHAKVAWQRIAGLRDVLIHAYFRVEPTEVWRIVSDEIPALRDDLARILAGLGTTPASA